MRKRKRDKKEAAEVAEVAEELASALDDVATEEATVDEAGDDVVPGEEADEADGAEAEVAVESPEVEIERLATELAEQQDRYLRLAAEFDNFRKRMLRERTEVSTRAKADVAGAILEGLDDLDRVSQLDPEQASSKDVIEGVELVERKLFRELEQAGLVRVGAAGDRFDPNYHEAVSATPAPDHEQEGSIAAVFQVGYRMGPMLLRPARVQVYVEQQSEEEPEA